MNHHTDLLIVGAGPFGLAMAAWAGEKGMDYLIVGKPMDLWRANMPQGMILRSHCDWHLDPAGIDTIERYLESRGRTPAAVEPLSRDFYLGYVDWFMARKGLAPIPDLVQRLDTADGSFLATLKSGATITANNVLLAIGFRYFQYVPEELARLLPARRVAHTCELVNFEPLRDKRCLIIGGRQSAFEWAALLAEHGAATVHVSHRHPTPEFTDSEWGWINEMMARFLTEPAWYRSLTGSEQEVVRSKFAEARIKLEPWLWPRIDKSNVFLWPETHVVSCAESASGELAIGLDNDETLAIDHVVLATGYRVNMQRVPFLAAGNILDKLALNEGYPVLDDGFQSSVAGLYVTSLPAIRDFGPFFGFTVAVGVSAKLIGQTLIENRRTG